MAYVTREAREQLLDTVAEATDELGTALAALGAAYEQLDEAAGDRLEERLFRPVQHAYGRAQRTYTGFAERHGLPARAFAARSAGVPSQGVHGFIERTLEAVEEADLILSELQDSMAPVEVGDPELRTGLAEVREIVADISDRAREFTRSYGR
jgi:hypothetical protein